MHCIAMILMEKKKILRTIVLLRPLHRLYYRLKISGYLVWLFNGYVLRWKKQRSHVMQLITHIR